MRISDWSSDVCSSDLPQGSPHPDPPSNQSCYVRTDGRTAAAPQVVHIRPVRKADCPPAASRSGQRRAGCRVSPASPRPANVPCGHFQETGQLPKRKRSEEHTSELQSLMRISYAVFCLKKKHKHNNTSTIT